MHGMHAWCAAMHTGTVLTLYMPYLSGQHTCMAGGSCERLMCMDGNMHVTADMMVRKIVRLCHAQHDHNTDERNSLLAMRALIPEPYLAFNSPTSSLHNI